MSRGRRSSVVTEATRRACEQRAQVGGEIRTSRLRRHWTQQHLADLAGVDRQIVGRIERGVTRLDIDVLQRVGVALDRNLEIRFGRDALEQPVDAGHLAMQELVLRLGRACGYTGTFELPTRPAEPWRSADVGLAAPTRRVLILGECWNTFGDVGAAARSSTRKLIDLEEPSDRAMGH